MIKFFKRLFGVHNYDFYIPEPIDIDSNSETSKIISEFIELRKKLDDKEIVLNEVMEICGGYFWAKDEDFRYTWASKSFLTDFYSLCSMKKLKGKDDFELAEAYEKRKKVNHSFAVGCSKTDEICLKLQQPIRTFEIGFIGNKKLMLDCFKSPSTTGGVIGFAVNQTHLYTEEMLDRGTKTGRLALIYEDVNGSKVYMVRTQILKVLETMEIPKELITG